MRSRFHSYASLSGALTRRRTRGITPAAPGRTFPRPAARPFQPNTGPLSLAACRPGTLSVLCGFFLYGFSIRKPGRFVKAAPGQGSSGAWMGMRTRVCVCRTLDSAPSPFAFFGKGYILPSG